MENRIIQTYFHEDLVKAIIAKSIINFNNNYIEVEDNNFNNTRVSSGLKLKPSDLSKHLLSDILYAINQDYYDQLTIENADTELNSHINSAILVKNEILKLVNKKEFFQYISYCFTALTFTSYFKYIQVLKRKIFDFYGENTIHHYSYLKKSRIEELFNNRELDSVEAITFFKEHKKLYWLAAAFRVFRPEHKGKNSIEVLRNILKEHGLSVKGWGFLIKQSEHYITRFTQNANVGIFCANFNLKDAWLRNEKIKKILPLIKNNKAYVHLGWFCQKWNRPVSKFNYFNTKFLKKLSYYSAISLRNDVESMIRNGVLLKNSHTYKILKDYNNEKSIYIYSSFNIMNKIHCNNDILADIEEKIENINKKYKEDKIFLTLSSPYYQAFLDIINDNNIKVNINFFNFRNITINQLKEKLSNLIIESLKDFESDRLKAEVEFSIDIIKKNFGNNIFMYVTEMSLDRDIFIDEFVDDELFIRVYDENPYMVSDAIQNIPFSGDNYISKYKDLLKEKGMTKSAWKNIHHLYKNIQVSKCFGKNNIMDNEKLENIIYFFNNKIHISNYSIYEYFIWSYLYSHIFFRENHEIINHNLNLLFVHLIKKMQEEIHVGKQEFLLDIIPMNRKKMYERIIERGQGRNTNISYYDLAQRDFQSMIDYLSNTTHELNHRSINSILEAANEWHENNYYNNLPYKTFKEDEVGQVIIDNKYEFKQLLNTKELQNESFTMHHCVARYNNECAYNEYVVYHMTNIINAENATLGIIRKNGIYTFNQMYAEYNNIISQEEINAGKYIVQCLNQKQYIDGISLDDMKVEQEEDLLIF